MPQNVWIDNNSEFVTKQCFYLKELKMKRRIFTKNALIFTSVSSLLAHEAIANDNPEWSDKGATERDSWMGSVIGKKSFDAPGAWSKFSDNMFYLQTPLPWKPNKPTPNISSVTVPKGFVTDLTSIPRPFWSLIPRDGSYADAAILHDYLYWTQSGTREAADLTFKLAMEDLEVHPAVVAIIFNGVRSFFGQRAWDKNNALKKSGESRLLAKFPSNSAARWQDWKSQQENIVKGG